MVTLYANQNRVVYGIQHYTLDEFADFTKLTEKPFVKPGSTAFIIETSKYYMLNGKNQWVEINPYGMNSSNGGSSGPSSPENNWIFDGGSIDGSDPI